MRLNTFLFLLAMCWAGNHAYGQDSLDVVTANSHWSYTQASYVGQSFTTGDNPSNNIQFELSGRGGPALNADAGFLLSQEFLGLPGELSNSTPGFVGQSTSVGPGFYPLRAFVFDPGITLAPNTKYYFYTNQEVFFALNDYIYTGKPDYIGGEMYSASSSGEVPFRHNASSDLYFTVWGGSGSTNEAPTVSCPEAVTSECNGPESHNVTLSIDLSDADGDSLNVEWTINGNVERDVSTSASTDSLTHAFGLGTSYVTVVVDDGTAEPVSCSTVVNIIDSEDPIALCGPDVVVDTDPGECTASNVALGQPTVSDNCEVASLTSDAPMVFDLGTTTVTWTVTDASGNSATCEQLVTVEDNEFPAVTAPADITTGHDAGMCDALVDLGEATASDNCGVAALTNDAPADNVLPVGTNWVTWTATDDSGNETTAIQVVTVTNSEPVADAGVGQVVLGTSVAGAMVSLDGSASSDPDVGDILSYQWTAVGITFDDATSESPIATFPLGTTTVTLEVSDQCGATSQSEVEIMINEAPTAVAGDDQSIRAGDNVSLDGSASFDDNTSSALLTYAWSIHSKPAGSTAVLTNADTAFPAFDSDVAGVYSIQLVVTDEEGADSVPAFVEIGSENLAPTAVANVDFDLAIVGEPVQFDGTESADPEMDSLSYSWTITMAPDGSSATLSGEDTANPTLTVDVEGTYELYLVVSDALGSGIPASIEVTATNATEFAEVVVIQASDLVADLTRDQVTQRGNRRTLGQLLRKSIRETQRGNTNKAIRNLSKAMARTDGCFLRGTPDGNGRGRDWVTDCDAQLEIYFLLDMALGALEE